MPNQMLHSLATLVTTSFGLLDLLLDRPQTLQMGQRQVTDLRNKVLRANTVCLHDFFKHFDYTGKIAKLW